MRVPACVSLCVCVQCLSAHLALKHDLCVAVCCSVLQCVAVCCSVSQCVSVSKFLVTFELAMSQIHHPARREILTPPFFAVCSSVLQYIAVCCSVLQCVAVYPPQLYLHIHTNTYMCPYNSINIYIFTYTYICTHAHVFR